MSTTAQIITTYLKEQASKTIPADAPQVKQGDKIAVHYVGRLDENSVFDTSVEHIAKAAGKHSPHRDYTSGLSFTVGAGQMIAGFDSGVVGMQVGETKTIEIPAKDAYGEYDDKKVQEVDMSHLPPNPQGYKKGDKLQSNFGIVHITSVGDTSVMVDFNHDLAGKDLIFDITVISID